MEVLKYFPTSSEEEYISKFIEMIYSEINSLKRV